MKNNNEIVQRIKGCYVASDCLQLMFRKDGDAITILNKEGIVYHKKDNSNFFVDKSSERRKKYVFPYSKIPYFKVKNGECISQILDFDKMYITISNGHIIENYALKDGKEALVASKVLTPVKEDTKICSISEVEDLFHKSEGNTFCLDGSKRNFNRKIIDEDIILNEHKNWLKANIMLELYVLGKDGYKSNYIRTNSYGDLYHSDESIEIMRKICDDYLNKLTIDDVDKKYSICSNTIFVNNGNNDIESIKKISVNFLGHDKYEVITYDYPLTKYTLEHLKQLEVTNLVITKEPKISIFLNPGVDVEEIVNSKELVKKYKR